jgi:large subunit ribosomal protein L18
MNKQVQMKERRDRRRNRVQVSGTPERPRLSVYRSLNHVYAQLIDDSTGRTLAAVRDADLGDAATKGKTKVEVSFEVGKMIAKKAADAKITTVVFDRGPFQYHGRVSAVADGAREGGLKF